MGKLAYTTPMAIGAVRAIRDGTGVLQKFYPDADVRNTIADAVANDGAYTGLANSMADYVTIAEGLRIQVAEEDGSSRMLVAGGGDLVVLPRHIITFTSLNKLHNKGSLRFEEVSFSMDDTDSLYFSIGVQH